MGWNAASNNLLPYSKGDEFPAFLTWRAAVDKGLIDLMRPLFDFGVRPEQFSNLILEQHAKEHSRQYLKYERKLEEVNFQGKKPQMYSDFADKEKYAGVVPTGNYFALVYKRYHKTIRTFLSKEVKKRDSRQLSWDVSYKVNKKMCQYHGQAVSFYTHAFATFVIVDACIVTNMLCHSVLLHHLQVFKGLVTATNEYGEIRIQFYVVTDGHDQMESAVQAFLATTNAYGQRPLNLVFSDNPTADDEWFKSQIPSIQASQDRLDEAASTENDGCARLPQNRPLRHMAGRWNPKPCAKEPRNPAVSRLVQCK